MKAILGVSLRMNLQEEMQLRMQGARLSPVLLQSEAAFLDVWAVKGWINWLGLDWLGCACN